MRTCTRCGKKFEGDGDRCPECRAALAAQTVTSSQAPGIVRAAIQEANALASQRKFASAYDVLANVAQRIVHWGATKTLRRAFVRPGGSWDAMGLGCEAWKLPHEVMRASSALQEAVRL